MHVSPRFPAAVRAALVRVVAAGSLCVILNTTAYAQEPATEKAATKEAVAVSADSAESKGESTKPKKAVIDKTKSILKGRITLKGTPPKPRKIQITKDPEICSANGTTLVDTEVGKDGAVANVVVVIEKVQPEDGKSWEWNHPKSGYVMRQKNCSFKPYTLVIPRGENLTVHNDDPVSHNVNTGEWNVMQAAGSEPIVKPVNSKRPLRIGCNVHSWMEGWIYPIDNPFFAMTDKKGNFEIINVPPGKYRVVAWHSNLGRKR
ncbi:MAG: hypothetical protein AAF497_15750, partial [Planctomycetota bacterium]